MKSFQISQTLQTANIEISDLTIAQDMKIGNMNDVPKATP